MLNRSISRSETIRDVWPGLVDVIIATLMILLLFMIIQYIIFFLSDALKRLEITKRQDRLLELIAELKDKGKVPKESITVVTTINNQKLRFSSTLLFPVGKAEIPPERKDSFEFLSAIGEMFHQAFYDEQLFDQIYIEGHTDSTPINTRRFPTNWELSTARAVYVTKYFIDEKYLVPKLSENRFLGAAGYGEFNFVKSESEKATNRRIEILLVYKEK